MVLFNDRLADVLSDDNPVLTCIGLGKRTEKKNSKSAPSPLQLQQAKEIREDPEVWSPSGCPQPWTPSYHTCHQPRHEPWVHSFDFALPRTTEWDRFESLVEELDSKQSDPSPPREICSITDLEATRSTRFGRFDAFQQHSPLMKPPDNEGCPEKQEESGDPTQSRILGKKVKAASQTVCKRIGGKLVRGLPEERSEGAEKDEEDKGEVGAGRPFTKGHRRSGDSLESLYSLNSGQSSSSGVTSGSDCSSNRGSLRLEEDLPYSSQFCSRARVHTDFVPSPYDTESLTLKVGDVIDIIAKPPMGIWTGVLNDKIGNFKFIYVDVLPDKGPETHEKTQTRIRSQKSRPETLQELLKQLSLEEYSSSLRLNGYQTADDLMRLRERHLTELNVTDPEHRHRLLAAADSLQQPDSHLEAEANQEAGTPGENIKAGTNNCPRDSGCHMPCESPDNSGEDTEILFPSICPPPPEMSAT
ncbi:SAM domain-containing protein SAMSN-1b [Centroberyx gerrardi]